MAEKWLSMEHPRTGERYDIREKDREKKLYLKDGELIAFEDAGFKAISGYADDGSTFPAPERKEREPAAAAKKDKD